MINRTERILFPLLFILSVAWIAFVGFVFWNMDPKFGGPYRWSIFVKPHFYVIALLPPAHILSFSLGISIFVRRVIRKNRQRRFRHLISSTLFVPLICLTIFALLFWIFNSFSFVHAVDDMTDAIADVVDARKPIIGWTGYFAKLWPLYAFLFLFIFPIRSWMWLSASSLSLAVPFIWFLVVEHYTVRQYREIDGVSTLVSVSRPEWASEINDYMNDFIGILLILFLLQISIGLVVGLVRLPKALFVQQKALS
ncbi:hypothetical protein [Pseudaestuariivita rosea]|uniref:hypothetical protein n=1 Tax=Pseudaestuariivita rosea TaxID=2763263 RepID=UPI001ABAF2E1|nr:hypothetical protein [Pseudaestuariivita rosea]